MGEFSQVLNELKKTLRKILLFDIFIETLLIFLCLYIIRIIINLPKYIAYVPALIYFVVMLYRRRKLTSVRNVEQKYPILNEALRTAGDTIQEDNYLVNELRIQVKDKVKNVSASTFLDIKGDILKVLISIVLVFVLVGLSVCRNTNETCNAVLSKTDVKKAIDNIEIGDIYSQFNKETISAFNLNGSPVKDNFNVDTKQQLLGDDTIATLGDDKLKIQIRLSNDQIDIHDVNDNVRKKEFMDMDITGIGASNDVSFEEDISKEHKEIVKNYFNTISR